MSINRFGRGLKKEINKVKQNKSFKIMNANTTALQDIDLKRKGATTNNVFNLTGNRIFVDDSLLTMNIEGKNILLGYSPYIIKKDVMEIS